MSATQIANLKLASAPRAARPTLPIMNAVLWTAQVLWGVFFSFTGFGKAMCFRPEVWNQTLHQPVPWFSAVPQGLFVLIGICEFLGGAGLILPALTKVRPKLTPLAASGLALVMLLAALFHIVRGEYNFYVPMNLVLGAVAALIAYGRFRRPIAPAPLNIARTLVGLVVLGALAFSGFAPIAYQLTHTH
jgi:uncharacterized membrane protein YphA (DoxX/SURF4 family)